jgi:hypothetical protein
MRKHKKRTQMPTIAAKTSNPKIKLVDNRNANRVEITITIKKPTQLLSFSARKIL